MPKPVSIFMSFCSNCGAQISGEERAGTLQERDSNCTYCVERREKREAGIQLRMFPPKTSVIYDWNNLKMTLYLGSIRPVTDGND